MARFHQNIDETEKTMQKLMGGIPVSYRQDRRQVLRVSHLRILLCEYTQISYSTRSGRDQGNTWKSGHSTSWMDQLEKDYGWHRQRSSNPRHRCTMFPAWWSHEPTRRSSVQWMSVRRCGDDL